MKKPRRRANRVWFRKQTGWYYTTWRGKQVPLAQTEGEAQAELANLITQDPPLPSDEVSMADLLLAYLKDAGPDSPNRVRPSRYRDLDIAYTDFCQHYAEVIVNELRPSHMEGWRAQHSAPGRGKNRPWTDGTFSFKVGCIRRALNWAVERGDVTRNPLGKFKGPGYERREHLITDEELALLEQYAPPWLKDLLLVLKQTGCRPSEACRVTAANYDKARCCWILKDHKRRKKKPAPRVIWLTEDVVKLTEKLVAAHPEGAIFRNARNRPITKYLVVGGFRTIERAMARDKKTLNPEVTAYGLRHRWITNALVSGLDVATVATLAGTSVQMIMKHYSHLLQRPDAMQAAARRAIGG